MFSRLFILSLISLLTLSSCSVYRSAVRKDFENRAPGHVSAASLGDCVELSPLSAWIEREFPGGAFELLIAENDLEVWKRSFPDGQVEIRGFHSVENQTLTCHQVYASEGDWEASLPAYLELLESALD